MKLFDAHLKSIQLISALPAVTVLVASMIGPGCSDKEHDLFTNGFSCENPLHKNFGHCSATVTTK